MVNPHFVIKRIAFTVCITVVTAMPVLAQQDWFIFVQADNNQPFYAKLGEKIYSSSSIGYLVLPGLKDSTYNLAIGFPKNRFREQTYSVSINKKDQGFQLKRNSDQVWVLYNWQNSQSLEPVQDSQNTNSLYGDQKKTDGFATLMSAVVNDTSVLYMSVVKTEEPVKEEKKEVKADTPDVKKASVVKVIKKPVVKPKAKPPVTRTKPPVVAKTKQPVVVIDTVKTMAKTDTAVLYEEVVKTPPAPLVFKPAITKLTELSGKNEKWLVYIDATYEKADTISIHIPIGEELVKPDTSAVTADKSKTVADSPFVIKKDTVAIEVPKQEVKKPGTIEKIPDAEIKQAPPEKKVVMMVNSDCQNFAKESDIDKLRIKMLAESDIKNKIAAAQKLFKTACLTAKQIRALSELFTTDETRYKFFEAAYPFVADTDNFKLLVELLTEESYVSKFKTLVRM
jgi:hypothetical protein